MANAAVQLELGGVKLMNKEFLRFREALGCFRWRLGRFLRERAHAAQ